MFNLFHEESCQSPLYQLYQERIRKEGEGEGARSAHALTVVSQVSAHERSTIPPYFSLPWALTMCQIVHKISGWSQCIITIVMASVPYRVLVKAVAFFR